MDFREFVRLAGMQTPFDDLSVYDKARILGPVTPEIMRDIEALSGPPIPPELQDRFDRAIKDSMNR